MLNRVIYIVLFQCFQVLLLLQFIHTEGTRPTCSGRLTFTHHEKADIFTGLQTHYYIDHSSNSMKSFRKQCTYKPSGNTLTFSLVSQTGFSLHTQKHTHICGCSTYRFMCKELYHLTMVLSFFCQYFLLS